MAEPAGASAGSDRELSQPALPTLSVVLPNYNHAQLIPRALEALLAQRPAPDEIIVVDDASTDESLKVVSAFADQHPIIRIIRTEKNAGAIPSLARGFKEARGRYVYFAAADDWVMPGFFAAAIAMLDANPQAGIFCGEAQLIDGASGRMVATRPPVRPVYRAAAVGASETRQLLKRMDNWILTGSSVFRCDAVVAAGGLDERLGSFADGYLARKIALTHGFCYWPRLAATWCVYPDSYSRSTALNIARAQAALAAMPARLAADPAFPEWYSGVFARRWTFAVARLAVAATPLNRNLLMSLAGGPGLDGSVLKAALKLPTRLARFTILVWLWFRLRPTTLIGLVATTLARAGERIVGRWGEQR